MGSTVTAADGSPEDELPTSWPVDEDHLAIPIRGVTKNTEVPTVEPLKEH